jgi:archaellum component FlaC
VQSELDQKLSKLAESPELRVLRDPLATMVKHIFQSLQQAGINDSSFSNTSEISKSASISATVQAEEIQRLKTLNERLEGRVRELVSAKSNPIAAAETTALQSRCDTLVKEREAVQTIMEQKIKVLVQSVAQAANAVVAGNIASTNPQASAAQALTKDVAALQRLVNASIAALRNAANNNQPAKPSASSGGASNGSSSAYPLQGGYNPPAAAMQHSSSASSTIPSAPMTNDSPLMRHSNSFSGSSSSTTTTPYPSQGAYTSTTTSFPNASNGIGRFSYDGSTGGDSRGSMPSAGMSRASFSQTANGGSTGMKMSIDSFLARSKISE